MLLNQSLLCVELEFGPVNGKIMDVKLCHGDSVITAVPGQDHKATVCIPTTLPGMISMVFSGKDHHTDTVLDQDGNITQDLFVKILGVSLDGFRPGDSMVHQCFTINTQSGDAITTSYIGFNGQINFELSKIDAFSQVMEWRRNYG